MKTVWTFLIGSWRKNWRSVAYMFATIMLSLVVLVALFKGDRVAYWVEQWTGIESYVDVDQDQMDRIENNTSNTLRLVRGFIRNQ